MDESNGEDKYENILRDVFDETKTAVENFEAWFAKSFDTYQNAEKYFEPEYQ